MKAYPDLYRKVCTIYSSWTRPISDNAEDDPRFRPPTPEPSDSSLRQSFCQTASHRLAHYRLRSPSFSVLDTELGYPSTDSSSRPSMEWASDNESYRRPCYSSDEDVGSGETIHSSVPGTPQLSQVTADANVSPPQRRNLNAKSEITKLTSKSLGWLGGSLGSSKRRSRDEITQWLQETNSRPSKRRTTYR